MSDFSYLKKHEVTPDHVARFTLWQLEGHPWLGVKPATQVNRRYFNASLKENARLANALRSGRQFDAAMVDETRAVDRTLYPLHVVVGWGNVIGTDGEPVSFSSEECAAFLSALPDYLFDEVRAFAANINNFVDVADFGETEKN